MDLPAGILDPLWLGIGWAVSIVVVLMAAWQLAKKIRQRHFAVEQQFNPWLGGIVVLLAFWLMGIEAAHGLRLHLLGTAVMALMFGPAAAVLALLVVALAVSANGNAVWVMLGPNFVLEALLPVAVISVWQRLVYRSLPHHLFVYLFANGFFGVALSSVLAGLSAVALVALQGGGALGFGGLAEVWMPPLLLLSFSEAWLSGMSLTLLVIYRPEWVSSFDTREYLSKS